jgi:hypothetical protein
MPKVTPATTYTLDDFIQMKISDDMTYYNFSILQVIDGIEHLDHNLIEDYLPELKSVCLTITLNPQEFTRYKYNPDLLAYDVYGSVQLDFILLLLNDTIDPKEFDRRTLILPYSSSLAAFLNTVHSKEAEYIGENRAANNLI